MKKTFYIFTTVAFNMVFAQKNETKIADRYQSTQPQDLSVPLPPKITFPAQFPDGNKAFLKRIDQNINKENLKNIGKNLNTEIILKIDAEGNVLNISTYGKNDTFNKEIKAAVAKSTENIKWNAGKNSQGENVVDIVRLPYRFNHANKKDEAK